MNILGHSPDKIEQLAEAGSFHLGLFIDSLDPGGAERVVINLAKGMTGFGLQVTVYHFGNPWLAQAADKHGLRQSILHNRRLYKSKATLLAFAWQFRTMLKRDRVDVLHSHLLGAVFAGSIAARLAGIGAIGTLHDIYSLDESRNAVAMIRTASRLGSRLVAVAKAIQIIVGKQAGRTSQQVALIYNGVDVGAFAPRRHANLEEPIKLVCVARLVTIKRIDVLVRAVALLPQSLSWRLEVIGDGPLETELKLLSAELGVDERIEFAGFSGDVPRRLSEADIFVLTSDSEGLSVSITESMAAGMPAVVTDVGGNSELVINDKSGLLVPAGDVDQFASAIGQLMNDNDRRLAMGERAREIAMQKFSLNAMLRAHVTEYRNCLRC